MSVTVVTAQYVELFDVLPAFYERSGVPNLCERVLHVHY